MRFRLRTLLIVAAIGPPTIWTLGVLWKFDTFNDRFLILLSLWTAAWALAIGGALDAIGWLLRRKRPGPRQ